MQVGLSTRQVSTSQQALTLLNKAQEAKAAPFEKQARTTSPWSAGSLESTVSGRAIATIQQLVQGQGSATTTFKIQGGGEKTVPTDEYEFAAKTSFRNIEEARDYFLATETSRREAILADVTNRGLTDHVAHYQTYLETWKRSMANGTVKVELLDDRVPAQTDYTAIRWPDGSVASIAGEVVVPFDWEAFNRVFGDGKGGYDRNYTVGVGGNYFMRGYVISWEK
jgi:hypothetical protein